MAENQLKPGGPRSAGSIPQRRVPQLWPEGRPFRILSLDGGGIRGIYTASILADLEQRLCGGRRVAEYFDLIAGTSTGGILALGLGAGLPAGELRDLYVDRGHEIFPERKNTFAGRVRARVEDALQYVLYRYERDAVARLLTEKLQGKLFGESLNRLIIPSFDGKHSEVFVYKTPHHADYKFDRFEKMVNVGLATSAAPSFFRPFPNGGYQLVDGGVWANNPIMLAVIEALICFTVRPEQIEVLSIGCGEDPYIVNRMQMAFGGKLMWGDSIFAAMRLQSMAATNQARLLLGPPAVTRLLPASFTPPIDLDDWRRARDLLPGEAAKTLTQSGDAIAAKFLRHHADAYIPVPPDPSVKPSKG
ncbi:MAG: patatin [Alphaproteobacteria bacterium]|nr:MAG: patatin [Alphaproteobacteria bacterium]